MASKLQFLGFLLILCSALMISSAEASNPLQKFEKWIKKYGKSYGSPAEESYRFEVFTKNLKFIEDFAKSGEKSYTVGLNGFADLTTDEFVKLKTGYKQPSESSYSPPSSTTDFNITAMRFPSAIDWRRRGAVTYVKDQGNCGSCWAFSTVATIEGINKIKNGKLIALSEQELVDCDTYDYGCNGGWPSVTYQWIIKNGGIAPESDYPYVKINQTCDSSLLTDIGVSIRGYQLVPANSEYSLMLAVAKQPVSVALDANNTGFQLYKRGVFTGPCRTDDLNHAVTVVGYGKSRNGIKYWILKNSWSTDWGMNGYMLIKRDVAAREGLCGMARAASYPII